jgi:hypothetical protein
MNPQTIRALAWQIRSGTLTIEAGRVVIVETMLQTAANRQARGTVQECADEINNYLSSNGLNFASLAELQKHFDNLEKDL